MSSFHNEDVIHNQAQLQYHYGPVFHGPIYHGPVQSTSDMQVEPNVMSALEASTSDEKIKQSLAFSDMFTRRSNVEDPHHDTCHWILSHDRYREWMNESRGLLWIKGKPGAGKSTLMAFLFRRLEEATSNNDVRLDFFFSARGSELQKQPLGMVRALLHQLFSQDPSVRPIIRKAYREKKDASGSDYDTVTWQWQRTELEGYFFRLVQKTAKQRKVQIFVDALDEAGGQNAREVASFFHRINDATTASEEGRLKICISCRHYPVPATRPGSEIHVEDHNRNDILQYVQDRFVFDQLTLNDAHDKEIWSELRDSIELRAAGVFQWVVLVIDLVDKYVAEGYCPDEIRSRIREVPEALSDLYDYIVRIVIEPQNRPSTLLLFQWICFATRPLSVEEMRYALTASDISSSPKVVKCQDTLNFVKNNRRMKARLTSLSGGLIEIAKGKESHDPDIVQVIHQSVRDFLFAHGLELTANLAAGESITEARHPPTGENKQLEERCHSLLYQCCLNYLTIEIPPPDGDLTPQIGRTEPRQWWDEFPLWSYATFSLMRHAKWSNLVSGPKKESNMQSLENILKRWTYFQSLGRKKADYDLPQRNFTAIGDMSHGVTLLHVAASIAWISLMRRLLGSGAVVDARDSRDQTALHCATEHGDLAAVRLLIESGANKNAADNCGRTSLFVAVAAHRWDIAELLLDTGVETETTGTVAWTPLSLVANYGHMKLVKRMISMGANVNAKAGDGRTALVAASQNGSLELVQFLLQAGADHGLHNPSEPSPLVTAAGCDHGDVVKLLLEAGAEIDSHGSTATALQQASAIRAYDTVSILISRGANVNATPGNLGGVLHAAAAYLDPKTARLNDENGHKLKLMFRQLLAAGADVNARGGEFETALAAASYYGDDDLVDILIGAGADLNVGLSHDASPLFVAIARSHVETAKHLIEAGADFMARDSCQNSILHIGAQAGNEKLLDILEPLDLDPNTQDLLGRTPLHAAVISRSYNYSLALVKHGAKCTITDAFGRTPLDYIYGSENIPDGLRLLLQNYSASRVDADINAIQKYLIVLVKTMKLKRRLPAAGPRFYDFVHCLSYLSHASLAWPWIQELRLIDSFKLRCVLCTDSLRASWFICGLCPYLDLCEVCASKYPPRERPELCCAHELVDMWANDIEGRGRRHFDWFGMFRDDRCVDLWFDEAFEHPLRLPEPVVGM